MQTTTSTSNPLCDGPYEAVVIGTSVDLTLSDGTSVIAYPDGFMYTEWKGFEISGSYGEIDILPLRRVLPKQAGGCIADREMLDDLCALLNDPLVDTLLQSAQHEEYVYTADGAQWCAADGVLSLTLTTNKMSMPFNGAFNAAYLYQVRAVLNSAMLHEFVTLTETFPDASEA